MDNRPQQGLFGPLTSDAQKATTTAQVLESVDRFNDLENKFKSLENSLKKSKTELAELKSELKDSKKDFVIFLGIFVSLIIFFSVEIQILKSANDLFILLGLSSFFLGAILFFSITLNNLLNEKSSWKDFANPMFIIIYGLFATSIFCFYLHFNCDLLHRLL